MEKFKTTLRGGFIMAMLLLSVVSSKACDLSNLTLLGVTPSGNGQYTISVRFCVGAGRTGVQLGGDMNTNLFRFSVPVGYQFVGFPSSVTSPQTGNVYSGTAVGNLLYYSNATNLPWACLQNCGQLQAVCYDFTFVVDGLPSALSVAGAEAAGNVNAGCNGTDMTVDPSSMAPGLVVNATLTHPNCPGDGGSISLSALGCTAPYSYQWSDGGTTASRTGLAPGSYSVTVQDAGATCSQVLQYTIVAAAPIAVNLGADRTVYFGYNPQSCALLSPTPTGVAPYTYLWSTGSTSATLNVCPTTATTYTVTMTDARGCSSSDAVLVNVVDVRCGSNLNKVLLCHNGSTSCVTQSQVANHLAHGDNLGPCNNRPATLQAMELSLIAYPVPAHDQLRLDVRVPVTGMVDLEVYDLQGKRIINQSLDMRTESAPQSVTLDVSAWTPGIYIARVRHENGDLRALKFSVER